MISLSEKSGENVMQIYFYSHQKTWVRLLFPPEFLYFQRKMHINNEEMPTHTERGIRSESHSWLVLLKVILKSTIVHKLQASSEDTLDIKAVLSLWSSQEQ